MISFVLNTIIIIVTSVSIINQKYLVYPMIKGRDPCLGEALGGPSRPSLTSQRTVPQNSQPLVPQEELWPRS